MGCGSGSGRGRERGREGRGEMEERRVGEGGDNLQIQMIGTRI